MGLKSVFFSFLLSVSLSLTAQDGISFTEFNTWSEVLAKAAAEDKLIFMDAYTTWCGPCKMMNSNIFPLEDVGAFFNTHFINVKVDMEKGEGIELAKRYAVNAYPTFLFVSAEGKLVHKGLGYQEVESFLDLGQAATDPARQYGTLSQLFDEGQLPATQMMAFANAALQVGEETLAARASTQWFDMQEDKMSPMVIEQIVDFVFPGPGTPIFDFVALNREQFIQALGPSQVDEALKNAIINSSRKSGEYSVETVHALFAKIFPEDLSRMFADEYTMIYYTYFKRGEPERKKEATEHYLNTYLDQIQDWDILNSAAWDVFESGTTQQADNLSALKWVKKSIELDENYFNTDTAASLCYRLGMKEEGIQYAQLAISLGKKNGMSVLATEQLLNKLNELE